MKKLNNRLGFFIRGFFIKKSFAFLFIFVVFIATFLFSGLAFSEYFEQYFVDTPTIDATLKQLESKDTPFTVYFNPAHIPPEYEYIEGDEAPENLYKIGLYYNCNQYNENEEDPNYGECMDPVLDLCPYISFVPNDGESTEDGFQLSPYLHEATGQLTNPSDMTDQWTLSVKSPCFVGECPADYNYMQNGAPLAQSQKGKTFKCDLDVSSNVPPVLMMNPLLPKVAYAEEFLNKISISAVFTGEVAGCTVDCFSNVLFLPGLEASRLYKEGIFGEDRLWEPNINADVADLFLDQNGNSINDVYTKDIIDKGLGFSPVYDSFIKKMDQLSIAKNFKFESFAYDWRQGINDIVNNGTKYKDEQKSLISTLEGLSNSSSTKKVTIVAHSNGGLLAKDLIVKLQELKNAGVSNLIDKIDNVILVASPQVGTPESILALLHGYNQKILGGLLLNTQTARQLAINMPSGYGLLPSLKYYQTSTTPVVSFDLNSDLSQADRDYYGDDINSFIEQSDFLLGKEGRPNPSISNTILPAIGSENLLNQSNELHNKIDNLIIPLNIKLIQLAGWGKDTLIGFKYVEKDICEYSIIGLNICVPKKILDIRPVTDMNGDGTVVSPSALYDNQGQKYWLDLSNSKLEHKNIFEDNSTLQFVENVITKNSLTIERIYAQQQAYTKVRDKISVHSPVTIGAYDSSGNFTGKICDSDSDFCKIVEDIPNSSYLEYGEGKYLNADEENISKIVLQGTDTGTFTYESERVLPDGTSSISSFIDIPVTAQTKAEVVLNNSTNTPELSLDVTGDGVKDFTLAPSGIFDPITYLQIMRATVDALDIPQSKIKKFDKGVDSIIKLIQEGGIDKVKLELEKFKNVLENELSKPDPKNPRGKNLSKTDTQMLLDMLNKLLDNIS
jgi:hypothetical protein